VSSGVGAPPFTGDSDVATISLRVKDDAPSVHDSGMLKFLTGISSTRANSYSGVARASDSSNILGNTSTANISIEPKNHTYSNADINNDKEINAVDLSIVISNFGLASSKASNPKADINGNHSVDIVDFSILLSNQ
jgi:hypothetical protein